MLVRGMARYLPQLGAPKVAELEAAWRERTEPWARQRLLVLRLIAQHELNAEQIAEAAGVARSTVFRYLDTFTAEGVAGLLVRKHAGGKTPVLKPQWQDELVAGLRAGRWRRARDVQAWLAQKGGHLALTTIYYWLGKAGGVLKVPRKTHAKKDAARVAEFRATLAQQLAALGAGAQRVRIWVADEHRFGLLPVIRRCWALRGVRVHAPYATRYQWGYVYEALEVDGANAVEALFVPAVDKDVSALFLRQIAETDAQARHIIIWDQAGFHPRDGEASVPANVRLLALPAYSPELNPVERLGDIVKDSICNRLFEKLDQLEAEVLAALDPFRTDPTRVARLIGTGWLAEQANASVPS
jgi:transposase